MSKADMQDRLIDQHFQHFADVSCNLDIKFKDSIREQNGKLEELKMCIADNYRRLADTCDSMNKQFVEKCVAQDERSERQYKHFTDVCRDLNSKIEDDSARQDGRIDDLVVASQQNYDHFTDAGSNMDTKISSKVSALQERLDTLHQNVLAACADLDRRLGEKIQEGHQHFAHLYKTLDSEVADQNVSLQQRTCRVEATVREHHQHFTTMVGDVERHLTHVCNKLDHKLNEDMSAIDTRMEQHHNHVLVVCKDMEDSLTARQALLETQIDDAHAHCSQLCAKIDLKLAECTDKISETECQHSPGS